MSRPALHLAQLAAALLLAAVGCSMSSVTNEAELPEPPTGAADADMPADAAAGDAPATDGPAEDGAPAAGDGAAKGSKADGESCDAPDDCASGICEGEGCGPGQGTCAPKERMCTRDLRPYCGCDGKTFQSSGSCPGGRFSKAAPCDGDPDGARLPVKK